MATGVSLQGLVLPVNCGSTEIHQHRDAIREQLGRILTSSLFKHSNHYRVLLRYIVEQALEGNSGPWKERILGVEVFGRDPLYDTNLDPVVRTSACEIRKRIAQYYSEPGRDLEIRIDVRSRSYAAEFRFPEPRVTETAIEAPPAVPEPLASPAAAPIVVTVQPWRRYAGTAAAVSTILVGISAAAVLRNNQSATDRFWSPLWSQSEAVIVCVAAGAETIPADPTRFAGVAFSDALAMARLTGLLGAHGQKFDVRRGGSLTLSDLRKVPVILIGAFNNEWTLSLENQLRFTFERDEATTAGWIRDRQNPSQKNWIQDPAVPRAKRTVDYAIVSRFLDTRTERTVVVVAGMGGDGTQAAGEFVTDSRYLDTLVANAPPGWEHKNVQAVIKTELINGHPGPPQVVAKHFW